MARIVSSYIHAGGEGKTLLTANLASELAFRKKRVAVLDLDPQGTLTALFGYPFEEIDPERDTLLAYLKGGSPPAPKEPALYEGHLHLWPAHLAMEVLNYDLHAQFAQAQAFARFLMALAEAGYDYVLVDLPPSSNAITKLTLLHTHGVVIPVTPTPKGAFGVQQAIDLLAVTRQQRVDNPRGYPRVVLAAINKLDERSSLQRTYAESIEELMAQHGIPTVRLTHRPGLHADAAAVPLPIPALLRHPELAQRALGRKPRTEALQAAREEVSRLVEKFAGRVAEL